MMRTTWFLASAALVWPAMRLSGADTSAILWQPRGGVAIDSWIWGPGGQADAPKGPFEFIDEDVNGTNAKIRVKDARGDRWVVKFGSENHSEVFASRLVYLMGYVAAPSYFVANGTISGVHGVRRAKPFIGRDGSFHNARFKLRDHKSLKKFDGQGWSWDDNPFLGTHELNGLKILLMLTSNWDAKDARDGSGGNTSVYSKPGSPKLYYAFDDWGATMGKSGSFLAWDKWDPQGYREQTRKFAKLSAAGKIEWGYGGKHGAEIICGITPDDVRWLMTYLSPVTDDDLRAGLRASGATQGEIESFTASIRDRIGQLQAIAADGNAASLAPAAQCPRAHSNIKR